MASRNQKLKTFFRCFNPETEQEVFIPKETYQYLETISQPFAVGRLPKFNLDRLDQLEYIRDVANREFIYVVPNTPVKAQKNDNSGSSSKAN